MGIERVEMILPLFMCKHRQTTCIPTGALPVLCSLYCINLLNQTINTLAFTQDQQLILNMKTTKGIFTQHATQNTPSKSYSWNIFTTKLIGRPFDSAGEEGGWYLAVYVELAYLFPNYFFLAIFTGVHMVITLRTFSLIENSPLYSIYRRESLTGFARRSSSNDPA